MRITRRIATLAAAATVAVSGVAIHAATSTADAGSNRHWYVLAMKLDEKPGSGAYGWFEMNGCEPMNADLAANRLWWKCSYIA